MSSGPSPSLSEEARPQERLQETTPPPAGQPQLSHHGKRRRKGNNTLPDITTLPLVVVAIICIIGCIVIVWYADGKIVAEWILIQPTVLLALFAAVFAFCTKLVFASGVGIVWWRTLQRHKVTLADLHYIHRRGLGDSIYDMATALHSTQAKLVLAVLVVITAVDLSDGPLLQRSIKTGLSIHTTQYHSSWHMAKIITDGWTGSIDHASTAGLYHSGDLAWMARNWYLNESLIGGDCGGVCNGSLSAAGIDVNCSSTTRNLDITAPKSVNASIFDVSFNRTQDSNGHATLEMTYLYMYSIDEHCNGTISIETCSIRTAVVSYDVTQTASVVRLARRSYPSAMSIIPSSGDLPGPDGRPTGALAALESIGTRYLQSNATLTGFYDGAYGIEPYGALELVYTEPSPGSSANSTCMLLYKNATDDLLWRLHDIMFRMAWDASIGNETAQTPIWTRDVRALSYDAEFATLWVAAGLMLLSITIATSLFWGYWQLEHPVSLSPLETGRALASILEEPAGERDMGVEELLNLIGQRKRD